MLWVAALHTTYLDLGPRDPASPAHSSVGTEDERGGCAAFNQDHDLKRPAFARAHLNATPDHLGTVLFERWSLDDTSRGKDGGFFECRALGQSHLDHDAVKVLGHVVGQLD